MDLLDLKDCWQKNKKGKRFSLLVMKKSSKFGWTIPLRKPLLKQQKTHLKAIMKRQKENQKYFRVMMEKKFQTKYSLNS